MLSSWSHGLLWTWGFEDGDLLFFRDELGSVLLKARRARCYFQLACDQGSEDVLYLFPTQILFWGSEAQAPPEAFWNADSQVSP